MDMFNLRKEFSLRTLDITEVESDPIAQFNVWFDEAVKSGEDEPNAMILSTATLNGKPSSRAVLLKQVKPEGFIFFTNYDSRKGRQLDMNPYCALNFYWKELERQIRIEGVATPINEYESDRYFEARPSKSNLGAWASPQSKVISDRGSLERLVADFETKFEGKVITRPKNWGGYIIRPYMVEFWQGRENRLHDRLQYNRENEIWTIQRLAP